jgi:hypothetical protein
MTESPAFNPVPLARTRHDGWTPAKQRAFVERLAECGVVSAAASAVGMTARSAYKLRARPDAASFAAAWDEAAARGRQRALFTAYDRAVNGHAQPIFYRGLQVGERRVYSDRLLIALLRRDKPERYG